MILLLQIFSCCFMTGVIWLVQILVYPNFRLIDPSLFQSYHRFHTKRITWIVVPAMGVELATGIWLFVIQSSVPYFWNLISILVIWIVTFFVSVPIHRHLEKNSIAEINRLIGSNWLRTILWTVRSAFWFWILLNQGLMGYK